MSGTICYLCLRSLIDKIHNQSKANLLFWVCVSHTVIQDDLYPVTPGEFSSCGDQDRYAYIYAFGHLVTPFSHYCETAESRFRRRIP